MAIVAGAVEDRGHLRRHLGARKDRLRFINWWICARGSNELDSREQNNAGNQNDFEDAKHLLAEDEMILR